MKPRSSARLALPLASAITALLAAQSAQAANNSWNVNNGGSWTTAASWSGGVIIPGTTTTDNSDVATFSTTLTANRAITVDTNRYIGGISFGNTSAFKYTIQTGTLHLNSGGVIQTLSANGGHTDSITSPIVISGTSAATATFTAGANSASSLLSITTGGITGSATAGNVTTLTLNGSNTGANNLVNDIGNGSAGGSLALVKSGTGTWSLGTTGSNTYTGGTSVTGGTLIAKTLAALPGYDSSGKVTFNGGTLQLPLSAWGSDMSVVNTLVSNATKTSGALALDTGNSPASFTQNAAYNLGAVGLTKIGTGTLILNQDNTYTGATTLTAGTLQVGSGGSTGSLGSTTGVSLAANTSLTFNRTGSLTVGALISGAATTAAVNITSGSTVVLTNTSSSFLGALNVLNGTVSVSVWNGDSSSGPLGAGSGKLYLGSSGFTGTLEYTNTDTTTNNRAINLVSSGTGMLQIDNAAASVNLGLGSGNPQITGAGNLVKSGLGTLISTNSHSNYTGTTTIQAGSLVAGASALVSTAGAFGTASSAIVLGNGSTGASDAPALINGGFSVSRDITVGSLSNSAAYNATIGGSNTTGTSIYSGGITLNTTATNYTATLQAANGGTVDFQGAWTTNNKAITIGSVGNTGKVQLSSAISTTGGISVNNGTLILNSAFSGGAMTVASGATLTNTSAGSIVGSASVNGILATGGVSTIGKLTSGALTFGIGSTFAFDMNHGAVLPDDANNLADLQIVNGNLTLPKTGIADLVLNDTAGTFAANTTTLSLIQYAGTWNGGFFSYGGTSLGNNQPFTDVNGNHWKITYNSDIGGLNFATAIPGSHFVTLSNLTAVPEPGTLLALGCLIGSGAFLRTRRRH